MTTTLKAVVRQMLALDPALGRSESIASLTTTTAVVSSLATGGSSQRFVNNWALRSDTATTADRIRRISQFTPASGTLTHAGTNYADTTATGEVVDILAHEPYIYHNAINVTLPRLKNLDTTSIPTAQNQRTVWLGDCDWILEPSDVLSVWWSPNPVISRNRWFEKYNSYDANGILAPDFWTISGSGATMARSTTQNNRSKYSLAITRSGTNCLVSQSVTYLPNGVSTENLRGVSVTGVAVVWSAVASQVRVQLSDGTATTSSSYHTGGSGWEELTVAATIAAAATNVTINVSVESDNTVAYVDEAYVIETAAMNDGVRRDNFESQYEKVSKNEWSQDGTLATYLPERGRQGQWVIKSQRGYPQLNSTRFAAGTADADTIDADPVKLATGAIARVYEALAEMSPENEARYGPLAGLWNGRFDRLGAQHTASDNVYQPLGARRLEALSRPVRRW